MLSAAPEPFAPFLEEVKPMLPLHYEELSLHKGRFPLNPNYDEYLRRDALGMVTAIVLRSAGKLVGYVVAFTAPGMHYQDCLTMTMDIYFVDPEYRGGNGGAIMFQALEAEARRRGVDLIFTGSKNHKDTSFLFGRLGYEAVETYHAKWMGDDASAGAS